MRIVDGDAESSLRDDHRLPCQRWARRVAMIALQADMSLLVGFYMLVSDDIERILWKVEQRELVLLEQRPLAFSLRVVAFVRPLEACIEQARVVALKVVDPWSGYEQVPPCGADLVLDRPLLVAGSGIAEAIVKLEVTCEPPEQLRCPHPLSNAMSNSRGVVEHKAVGHTANVGKNIQEPLADALGILPVKHLSQSYVGEREVDHKVVQAPLCTVDDEVRLPEVDLNLTWHPDKLQVLICRRSPCSSALFYIELYCRVSNLRAMLFNEMLMYAACAMALLVPASGILIQIALDDVFVRVENGWLAFLNGYRRRCRQKMPHLALMVQALILWFDWCH